MVVDDELLPEAIGRRAGFPLLGEPLALDVVNTVVEHPARDLLTDPTSAAEFWQLQAPRLPTGATAPDRTALADLRDALHLSFVRIIDGAAPPDQAVLEINRHAALASTHPVLAAADDRPATRLCWHPASGGDLTLAAVAASGIAVVTGPTRERLRRCANPDCRLLFVAANPRRQWCSAGLCGNRIRVARYYARTAAGRAGGAGASRPPRQGT